MPIMAGLPGPAQLGAGPIQLRFCTGDQQTRAVLADLRGQLVARGLGAGDLGTVELVLAEVLNNITEHAYGPDGGVVEVMLELAGRHLRCELRDFGRGMPAGTAPPSGLPVIAPPDILPEGGFGWHIIRCLVSDLQYERAADGNRLRLVLELAAPS